MFARPSKAQGFTLVEILIVVVILGILAAIVIPQFTSASEAAKASSLSTQLQSIRSQLQLYQIEHNGDYPDLSSNWDQITKTTSILGVVDSGGAGDYGPYLQKAPANPFYTTTGNANTAVNQAGDGTGSVAAPGHSTTQGWSYSRDTGEIKANLIHNAADAKKELGLEGTNDFNFKPAS
ncbi:MAG: prepilin-type N-terminal cleavage/methylation domain-containing protein [Planctomycetota bacterium]